MVTSHNRCLVIQLPSSSLDEIRKAVEGYSFEYESNKIHIMISADIEIYNNNISINQWIENADKKLYKAKESGKNKTIM